MVHLGHCGQISGKSDVKDVFQLSFQSFIMAAWPHVLGSNDRWSVSYFIIHSTGGQDPEEAVSGTQDVCLQQCRVKFNVKLHG